MRSEQWIRTQKRRVRKKYRKVGNVYFSPKEMRQLENGTYLSVLRKSIDRVLKSFQEYTIVLSDAVKVISEAYKEAEIYCGHSDEEVAKSFIESVSAVENQLEDKEAESD